MIMVKLGRSSEREAAAHAMPLNTEWEADEGEKERPGKDENKHCKKNQIQREVKMWKMEICF